MTAETRRDIQYSILRELYRVDPRGRTVKGLHTLITPSVPAAEPENVQEQVQLLSSMGFIEALPGDELAGGDKYYAITDKGCQYCETKNIV
jgi:hypothetical protein